MYITGLFGTKKVAAHVAEVQLLLPGFSVKQKVQISGIFPEIRDTGHVSISPLVIPGSVQPASGPYKGTLTFWAVPWTLVAIIVLIIFLLVLWLIIRRRRRRRSRQDRGGKSPTGPGGATVASEGDGKGTVPPKTDDGAAPEAKPSEEHPAPVASSEPEAVPEAK